jgi:hypothetical protein
MPTVKRTIPVRVSPATTTCIWKQQIRERFETCENVTALSEERGGYRKAKSVMPFDATTNPIESIPR